MTAGNAFIFLASTAIGGIGALRLMALNAAEHGTTLTIRGRLVVGLSIGLTIGVLSILIGGVWWDCDLRAGATGECRVTWVSPF